MKRFGRVFAWLAFLAILAVGGVMLLLQGRGTSARPEPSGLEESAALFMRSWMTPAMYKGLRNPVAASEENFAAAREHYADHCASCHANDGSGDTEMGRNLYPRAPDMRLARTQDLSDGELFYIIENGVMLTGMPAWSTNTPEGETASWQLVHFIRRLSKLTAADLEIMRSHNPVSRAVIEEERKIEEFLKGGDATAPAADPHAGHKQR